MVSSVVAWICMVFCFQGTKEQCVMVPLPCCALCLCWCQVGIGGTGGGGIGGSRSGFASLLGHAMSGAAAAYAMHLNDKPASPGM